MEKVVEKLDSYNILNNLLPGVVMVFLLRKELGINLVDDNMVEILFISYFVGMIISRVGSLVVEPICRIVKLVDHVTYEDFIRASKGDDKIELLSETNNSYRSFLTVGIIILMGKLCVFLATKVSIPSSAVDIIMILVIIIVFACAYRKQTDYIVKRVSNVNKREEK